MEPTCGALLFRLSRAELMSLLHEFTCILDYVLVLEKVEKCKFDKHVV